MEIPEKINLGFMFSNWYSGATLLAILLDNQRDIVCNGETFPFLDSEIDLYTCSCGNPLLQCDFYRNACSHMIDETGNRWQKNSLLILPRVSQLSLLDKWLKSYNYFSSLRNLFLQIIPPYNFLIKRFLESHLIFYHNSCRINQKKLYIDGTKSIRRAELFRLHKGISFKVIYLVRDGRGFCCSYVKNKRPRENLRQSAHAWIAYNKNIEHFRKKYPEIPVLTVRYEDLCRDLNRTMKYITSFFDVAHSDFQCHDNISHLLGNKMRKSFDGNIVEDLRWKTSLSTAEINMITSIMEQDLKYYEYI